MAAQKSKTPSIAELRAQLADAEAEQARIQAEEQARREAARLVRARKIRDEYEGRENALRAEQGGLQAAFEKAVGEGKWPAAEWAALQAVRPRIQIERDFYANAQTVLAQVGEPVGLPRPDLKDYPADLMQSIQQALRKLTAEVAANYRAKRAEELDGDEG